MPDDDELRPLLEPLDVLDESELLDVSELVALELGVLVAVLVVPLVLEFESDEVDPPVVLVEVLVVSALADSMPV